MSLKDAMQKVGLRSSKLENERQRKLKKEKTKAEKHQERRNFCEVCECIHPDVEQFKHKNSRIDAQWICVNCADKNEILDDFRVSAQSDFSIDGRYKRYYGHTVNLNEKKAAVQKDNRKPHKHKNDRHRDSNRTNNNSKRFSKGRNDRTNRRQDSKPKARYTIDENGEKNFNC